MQRRIACRYYNLGFTYELIVLLHITMVSQLQLNILIWARNDTFWICFLVDFWSWLLRAFVVLNHIQPAPSLTYVAFLLVHSFAIFITLSSKIWHCQNIYAAPKNLSPSMYDNMWYISLTPVHTFVYWYYWLVFCRIELILCALGTSSPVSSSYNISSYNNIYIYTQLSTFIKNDTRVCILCSFAFALFNEDKDIVPPTLLISH